MLSSIMANDQYLLKHYGHLAKVFGDSALSTIQDPYIRKFELDFIFSEVLRWIYQNSKIPEIVEVGCGNGHLLENLSQAFPEGNFRGFDFSPEMIEIAKKRNIKNVLFEKGDIRKPQVFQSDLVISQRVLVNLIGKRQQRTSLGNIAKMLKKGGLFIMSESYKRNLVNLNLARQEQGIEPILPSKHNLFLGDWIEGEFSKVGLKEIDSEIPSHSLSTHFFLTRVFHPVVRPEGSKAKYSSFIHFFDCALPDAIGEFSPIRFRVFQKV